MGLSALAQGSRVSSELDSDGTRIHFVEQGQGEPVILLHGFTADIESNWGDTGALDSLAQDFRVIAMDFRGHDKSAKPYDSAA